MAHPDALLNWITSLADATRLRLLRLLELHELTVQELCDILQLPQSTVSRHLKTLAGQNWIRSRQQATSHLYRMTLEQLESPSRKLWLLAREQTEPWATVAQDQLRLSRLLAERQRDSRAFFAGAATQWDQLRVELYGQTFANAAALSLLPRDATVADLGCGTGPMIELLAPHVGKVFGVDSSPPMLQAANARLAHHKNVTLHQAELTNIPLDDASIDAALLTLVLTYTPEPAAVLKETARILKPGGRAVIVDLLPHDRDDFRRQLGQVSMGFSPEALTARLHDAHLINVTVRALPPESNAKGPALFLATALK